MATYTTEVEISQGTFTTLSLWTITIPTSSIDYDSVESVLETAIPSSLISEAVTNSAAVSSEIESEFAGGATPSWFAGIPTDVQSALLTPTAPNQTAPGILGINVGGIQTPTTSSPVTPAPSFVTYTSTAAPTTPTPTPAPDHAGAIAGGVVGGLAGLALLPMGWLLYRRRRRTHKRWELENAEQVPMEPEAHVVSEMEAKEPTRELTGSEPLFELEGNSKPSELNAESEVSPSTLVVPSLTHFEWLKDVQSRRALVSSPTVYRMRNLFLAVDRSRREMKDAGDERYLPMNQSSQVWSAAVVAPAIAPWRDQQPSARRGGPMERHEAG